MASSRIKRADVQQLLKEKQRAVKKQRDFIAKLKKSLQIECIKVAELEGAILALHEILTGEKVE